MRIEHVATTLLMGLALQAHPADPRERSLEQHDAYGRVTRRADGERVVYPYDPARPPLPFGARPARVKSQRHEEPHRNGLEGAPSPVHPTLEVTEEWRRSIFGIGVNGLEVADLDQDGDVEIVATAGEFSSAGFWTVLRPVPGGFENAYASDELPEGIGSLRVAQLDGDPALEVAIGTDTPFDPAVGQTARIVVFDGVTHRIERTLVTPALSVRGLTFANVDADPSLEAVFCDDPPGEEGGLFVHDVATGALQFSLPGFGCDDLAVGNVDDDPGLEIVLARWGEPGQVVDAATRLVQWTYLPGFGNHVALANLDPDPRSEIVGSGIWGHIGIVDAVLQVEQGSISTSHDVGAIAVLDVEGDGPLEIVYGDGQFGRIHVHDAVTLAEKWSVDNPENGVTNLAVGNVDGDPTPELVWGAGVGDSGPDHLYVLDTVTRLREWDSLDFAGPFYALSHGDVDGDGQPEILYGSMETDHGYDGGVWFVHDARTKALEYVGGPTSDFGTSVLWRIRNANVDADPQQEVFVTGEAGDPSESAIFCVDGLTHAEQWHVTVPNGLTFQSLQVGNVDADPGLEVVASVDVVSTGAPGAYVYVFDAATGALEWQSPSLSSDFISFPFLRLGNVDGDANVEIVFAAEERHLYVADGVTHVIDDLGDFGVTALDLADRDGNGVSEIIVGDDEGGLRAVDAFGASTAIATYPDPIDGLAVRDVTGDGVADYVLAADEHVLIRDGATGIERWNSGRVRHGYYQGVGARDSLLVADIDVDGRLEIFVNLGSIGVRVWELPPSGDVALFVTDTPDPALVGGSVTYEWRVQNQGAAGALGVGLAVALPTGAAFVSSTPGAPTCTAAGGVLSCALPNLPGGAASVVTVVVTPSGPGALTTSGTLTLASPDPVPSNNTRTETTRVTASLESDLAVSVSDDQAVARPSEIIVYAIRVTNQGPWPVGSISVSDVVPAALEVITYGGDGNYDPGTGLWTGLDLAPGGLATLTLLARVTDDALSPIDYAVSVAPTSGSDPVPGNNSAVDSDRVRRGWTELDHGVTLTTSLGPAGERFFVLQQVEEASYEMVLDAVSGDLGDAGSPLRVERVTSSLVPFAASQAAGLGPGRSLRWRGVDDDEAVVRVASGECTTGCGPDDLFRVRFYDTTYDIPRFNNANGQATVLFIQNTGRAAVHGTLHFWTSFGSEAARVPFAIQSPRGTLVLPTTGIVDLQDESGSITVTHDAPYGTLAGKAVSIQPSTGFSFDAPMRPRPH